MASSWGAAWAEAWGDAWGLLTGAPATTEEDSGGIWRIEAERRQTQARWARIREAEARQAAQEAAERARAAIEQARRESAPTASPVEAFRGLPATETPTRAPQALTEAAAGLAALIQAVAPVSDPQPTAADIAAMALAAQKAANRNRAHILAALLTLH